MGSTRATVGIRLSAELADDPQITRMLDLARTHLGMEVAWLSTFVGGRLIIESVQGGTAALQLRAGDETDLSGTPCVRVVTGALPPAVTDTRRNLVTRDLPVIHELGIGSYVGAPWRDADGAVAGMICCVDSQARPDLNTASVGFLSMLADLIGDHLASPDTRRRDRRRVLAGTVHRILDNRDVTTVIQPVVRIADATTVAFEALSRFDPAVFATPDLGFAAAADCDLGISMELLAAGCALDLRHRLPAEHRLWINLSAEAARTGQARDLLLANAGDNIGIEITEHVPVQDYDALNRDLAPLRAAGVKLAVDDAGAGYASLTHILRLRPDTIKLDISLVRDIDQDPARRALTRCLADFAGQIDAELLAEGVESPAERDTLHELGIQNAQGYLWGRPAPLRS